MLFITHVQPLPETCMLQLRFIVLVNKKKTQLYL